MAFISDPDSPKSSSFSVMYNSIYPKTQFTNPSTKTLFDFSAIPILLEIFAQDMTT